MLFSANKQWREFVADYFGEQIDENDDYLYFDEALENYITHWFKRYENEPEVWVSSVKNLCKHIMELEQDNSALAEDITKKRSLLAYRTHVAIYGWSDWKFEKQLTNSLDQNLDIQAVRINFAKKFCNVYYSVYYNEQEGWSQEVVNGQVAGTTGQAKSIFGIKIRLDEVGAKDFDILYRVHKFDGTWSVWAENGAEIISDQKLNSLQIKLERKKTSDIGFTGASNFVASSNEWKLL